MTECPQQLEAADLAQAAQLARDAPDRWWHLWVRLCAQACVGFEQTPQLCGALGLFDGEFSQQPGAFGVG
ncbi:MAG: hypothetical protein ABS96_22695 [Lysobacteraceae bacterium SCN 69-123]|nr:MAG: hypothetical protein ABS96_22695 [Xanthomonadaceae bacterium SCN 69-123]